MSTPEPIQIRDAVPEDNPGLVALAAACPMRASMSLCVHREPDFFALSRVMGDPYYVFVAEDPGEGVVGCVAGAIRRIWVQGQPRPVMYTGDFKLRPDFRGRGIADRLLQTGWPLCESLGVPSLMAILKGNKPIERRLLNPPEGIPRPAFMGTVRVYSLMLPGLELPGRDDGLQVRPATPRDLDAMEQLWARVNPQRNGAPLLTAEGIRDFLAKASGLSLADYLLAFRRGKLVGSLALWNQESFKETRVLDFDRSIDWVRRGHDLLARGLGWPLLPARGQALKALHCLHLAVPADEPAVFAALLRQARRSCVAQGAPLLELGLDVRDPLTRVLRFLPRVSVDVNCFLTADPGSRVLPEPGGRPFYLETALV